MATRVASILAEIGIDSSKFGGGAKDILGGLEKIIGGFDASALAAGGLVAGLTAVIAAERELAAVAAESAMEQARFDIAYRNAGKSIGIAKEELQEFTKELSRSAGIDDEIITRAEALTITFGIQGKMIERTVAAAADLAAMEGGDLLSSTQKLDRALSSFDGYTALSRSMARLDDSQKAQIEKFKESNDLIGYQNYVLGLLEDNVNGAAGAVNAASDGSAAFNIELDNLKENIGSLLLPEVREFTANLTDLLIVINDNWDAVANLINIIRDLHRAMMAVMSLGLSEAFRWLFRSDKTPNLPDVKPQSGATPQAGGLGFMTPRQNNQPTPGATGSPTAGGLSIGAVYIGDTSNMTREQITGMMQTALAGAMSR